MFKLPCITHQIRMFLELILGYCYIRITYDENVVKNGYLVSFKAPIDYSNAKSVYVHFGIIIFFFLLYIFQSAYARINIFLFALAVLQIRKFLFATKLALFCLNILIICNAIFKLTKSPFHFLNTF